ncbi:hypothetical protein [Flavobacterium ginsengiterrae]|uniref:Uncharacterized protein n=1 Tax=Flavobacterium ginsengiterrae TaxID=871695 RepID=A0ABP7H232_9FLAO
MDTKTDKKDFNETLDKIDQRIKLLNNQKINAFFESLGFNEREDIPKDYLKWENILIVVPSRTILHNLKQYKTLISGISFVVNQNAEQIHIYDFKEWKKNTSNKTQFQIRELLKTNFGGVPKSTADRDWTKLR